MNQIHGRKKKSGCLGCLGIGCLVTVILLIIIPIGGTWYGLHKLKKVEFIQFLTGNKENSSIIDFTKTLMNDIEVTDADRYAGKITLRNKKTGDWVTISKDAIIINGKEYSIEASGKLKGLSTENLLENLGIKDETQLDKTHENIPEWVPIFPSAKVESTIDFSSTKTKKGTIEMTANATTDSIFAYYSKQLVEKGFTVEPKNKSFNNTSWLEITAVNKKQSYLMTITVKNFEGKRKISIAYNW